MSADYTSRFAEVEVLKGIGRRLLTQFLACFESDLAASTISAFQHFSVSAFRSLPDDAWFCAVAALLSSLSSLPPRLQEALHSIASMSEPGKPEDEVALDPEKTPEGADTLDPKGVPAIAKVTLRKVKIDGGNAFHETVTCKADDLFACADPTQPDPIPPGHIISASIAFHFAGSPSPHKVKLTSKSIKLTHPQDAIAVGCWLAKTGFLIKSLAAWIITSHAVEIFSDTAESLLESLPL